MVKVSEAFALLVEAITDKNDGFYRVVYAIYRELQLETLTASSPFCDAVLDITHPEVEVLMKSDVLAIRPVQLYAARSDVGYAFYLARDALSVKHLHSDTFRDTTKVINASRLLYTSFTLAATGETISPYDFRHRVPSLPYYLGRAEAGQYVLYR